MIYLFCDGVDFFLEENGLKMNLELIFLEENVLNMNLGLIVRCIIVITSAGVGWRLTAAVGGGVGHRRRRGERVGEEEEGV